MTAGYKTTTLFFELNNVGKPVYKKQYLYKGSHKRYLKVLLNEIGYENVLVVKYAHGKTKVMILEILKEFKQLEFLVKSKSKVIFINEKDSYIATDMLRTLLKDELWQQYL